MKYRRVLLYLAAAVVVMGAVVFFIRYKANISRILSPFLLTIPLVYIVRPVTNRLTAKKIPVSLAVLMVYLFFMAALAAAGIFFIPELALNTRELMETLPKLVGQYERIFNNFIFSINSSKWSEQVKGAIFNEIANVIETVQKLLVNFLENGLDILVDIVRIIVDFTIAMVITYYVIKDGVKFKDYALLLLPRRWRAGTIDLGKKISRILAGFIQGQLMTALIVGVLETMGLILVRMKYPLVLGMIGGLANIIPYFGPYIGAIPAVAIALTISPLKAVWAAAVFILIQQIDNNFISPKMIEGKLGLHPVATIFAVLVGGEFFGIAGMLLAVPVMAILRVLVNKAVEAIA